jgi:hypothetical protein
VCIFVALFNSSENWAGESFNEVVLTALITQHVMKYQHDCYVVNLREPIWSIQAILWHVDPLLGNDCEVSKYTAAVTE